MADNERDACAEGKASRTWVAECDGTQEDAAAGSGAKYLRGAVLLLTCLIVVLVLGLLVLVLYVLLLS